MKHSNIPTLQHSNTPTYAILGGGMLGLTLALRLTQQGHKVTVYEAAPKIGGLASAWNLGEVSWDKFYHVILLSDLKTRGILKELDLEDEMNWVETKTGFYTDGQLYSMSDTLEFLKFPPLNLIDKLRLGGTIFYTSKLKNWKRLEKIPVEKFLKRLSGKNTFNKMWLPLLRAKLGEEYKHTSAAFIWATIQRMYSARKSGLKKEMFGYLEGGYARFLERFEEKLREMGVEFRMEEIVQNVGNVGNVTHIPNTTHTLPQIEVTTSKGSKSFNKIISTLPSSLTRKMVPELTEEELKLHDGIQYLGVVCPSVVLKKKISPYYVTNITDDGVPFTGIIEMTALVDPKKLKNKHLVYLPKYVRSDDPLFKQDDESIAAHFTDELLNLHPHIKKVDIESVKIARARQVFALNTLGYSESVPKIETSIKGLFILNSAQITNGTLNVNESIDLAERFVKEML